MSEPKVMVALRDAESVRSLVTLACGMAKGMNADLIALHVVEIPMSTPLDADDEIIDRSGKQILSLARVAASGCFSKSILTRLVRARQAGEAIVDEAKEQGIDLLIMGYYQPHRIGEVLLGSVVQHVARHAPCRVMVQIPPVHESVKMGKTSAPAHEEREGEFASPSFLQRR